MRNICYLLLTCCVIAGTVLGCATTCTKGSACGKSCSSTAKCDTAAVCTACPKELIKMAKAKQGYQPLLKDDLSNAIMEPGGWSYSNGVLATEGKGDLWTKERYGNFALALEFKCTDDTNSGVFIRTSDIDNWLHTAIEVQVLQPNDEYPNPKWHCGSIFDCLEPSKQMVKQAGEWNQYYIVALHNRIVVELNGETVIDMDLNQWTEAHKNPDGTKNKFDYAYKDLPREGHIGVQFHGNPIWYRNLKIKAL